MKVLIACEFSGIVRDAFKARGHGAWSCDLLPTEREGNHIQGDVLAILNDGWDLMIAHPPCTYMSNAGARWLYPKGILNQDRLKLPLFMPETFKRAVSFIDRHPGAVLIHCNEGFSRAPSLALVYLAFWNELPAESYNAARKAYLAKDPLYAPKEGIVKYLIEHWVEVTQGENR